MTMLPKILVADDDQALSRTLSWILKENGYDVLTVPGGEHLFDHLQAEPFDLLLLDIMMPKVDGLQLLQKVKSDPRYKDLPVLMISSMPPEEATVRSLGLGAADFIPKPFRVRELLARVKAHLRVGRELNQARAEARSRSEMMDIMQEVTASLKPEEIYQILVRRVVREAVTVTEDEIAEGVRYLHQHGGLRAEPSGAVAVAALLAGRVRPAGPTVAVVSGGNVDPDLFRRLVA